MSRTDILLTTMFDNVTFANGTTGANLNHAIGHQQSIIGTFTPVATAVAAFTNGAINVTSDQIVVTSHGYKTGQAVNLTSTVASLWDAIATASTYYIILNDGNTVQLATTRANAASGTYIDFLVNSTAATYTLSPLTLTACYVWKQHSNDGSVWADVDSSTLTVSAVTTKHWGAHDYGAQYTRLAITMTGGQITVNASSRSIGY